MARAPAAYGSPTASGRVREAVSRTLEPWRSVPGAGACVALSGGLDSSVLLHALAREAVVPARAVHVNHQIHVNAADWARHCESYCTALGVPFIQRTVTVDVTAGEGVEAAARRARYRAIADVLRPGEVLLTAHHESDQAETVLLHLLRGSGVVGLRGIPRQSQVEGCAVLRPLLELPRVVLLEYARDACLDWVEDPANLDPQLDRNFLRHEILPTLAKRWPGVIAAIARSSRLCAEAAELTDALAAQDLRRVSRKGRLSIAALRELNEERQRNLIRYWCREGVGSAPPGQRLREGLAQLLNAGEDRHPLLAWPGGEIRRYRSALYLLPAEAIALVPAGAFVLPVRPGAPLELGKGLGRLRLVRARGQGLSAARVGAELSVRFRKGGERLRPAGGARTRDLKNLLQERGVVPWMRDRIPLLYSGETLAAVAGLWVAAEFVARGDEPGLRVRWDDHPALD